MNTLTTKVLREAMLVQNGLLDTIDSLVAEVEKLKEALRKCCPHCESIEDLVEPKCCIFCGGFLLHADDCEYIKLCGEDKIRD